MALENETTYYWRVIAINECGETVSETNTFTTESIVSINELESNNFSSLPNPTTDHFEIVFEQMMNKDLTIELYSVDGRLLQNHQISDTFLRLPIDMSIYSAGVYF